MASIKEITNKSGAKSYKVTVSMGRDANGKQILKYATFVPDPNKTERQNKKALDRFVFEFEDKCKSGQIVSEKTTLKDFSDYWLNTYAVKLEKTTYNNYVSYLNKTILPKLGHMKLSSIRPSTVQRFLDNMREEGYDYGYRKGKYSDSAVQTAKKILSSILSYAVINDILPSNPAAVKQRQHKKVEKKQEVKCFDIQQAIKFLSFIEKPIPMYVPEHYVTRKGKRVLISEYLLGNYVVQLKYRAAFALTIFSGVRKEELLGLQWKDVDFRACSIDINKAVVYLPKEGYLVKAPKSEAGFRKIYLPQSCMDLMKKLKIEQRKNILNQGTAWEGSREIEENWCFTQENGLHMSPSTPRQELQRVIRAYNRNCKKEEDKLPVITFHQLRHTSASILIAQGMEPTAVAKRLGHHDASVTLSIYAHSFEERDKAASNALESALLKRSV